MTNRGKFSEHQKGIFARYLSTNFELLQQVYLRVLAALIFASTYLKATGLGAGIMAGFYN